jgi:c-di-GMP-binding flagellar brake protein YcgR
MENRRYPRVAVDPQCRVRFQLGDRCYGNIPIADLGAGGCCIRVPSQVAVGLAGQAPVESLELIHPRLPQEPIKARIAWVHGADGASGTLESGVQFLEVPAAYTQRITEFVRS